MIGFMHNMTEHLAIDSLGELTFSHTIVDDDLVELDTSFEHFQAVAPSRIESQ